MPAHRVAHLKSSFIRDILAVTQREEIISFAGGLPDPAFFPVDELAQSTAAVLAQQSPGIYQYATTEGLPVLRQWIGEHLCDNHPAPENILITSGSQQGLDLAIRCLLNPGDTVLIEAPSYLGAIQNLHAGEARLVSIPMEQDGPNLKALVETLETEDIKAFYCIPNFQNPSGISYSLEKRLAIAELFRHRNIWIIEDDPYGKLRYLGAPLPSLHSLLPEKTLYLGSFSKIIAPSLRIGWVVAPAHIMALLRTMKQVTDLHSSSFTQGIIAEFLTRGLLTPHLQSLCNIYSDRLKQMRDALHAHLPDVETSSPEGGMFLWLKLKIPQDTIALTYQAIDQGVAFVPGEAFFTGTPPTESFLRLNFTNTFEEKITQGIERLARIIG